MVSLAVVGLAVVSLAVVSLAVVSLAVVGLAIVTQCPYPVPGVPPASSLRRPSRSPNCAPLSVAAPSSLALTLTLTQTQAPTLTQTQTQTQTQTLALTLALTLTRWQRDRHGGRNLPRAIGRLGARAARRAVGRPRPLFGASARSDCRGGEVQYVYSQ